MLSLSLFKKRLKKVSLNTLGTDTDVFRGNYRKTLAGTKKDGISLEMPSFFVPAPVLQEPGKFFKLQCL